MERPQFAYTGPAPEKGYVGFVNIQQTEDGSGLRFTVRSEGEEPVTASYVVPLRDAAQVLHATLFDLEVEAARAA